MRRFRKESSERPFSVDKYGDAPQGQPFGEAPQGKPFSGNGQGEDAVRVPEFLARGEAPKAGTKKQRNKVFGRVAYLFSAMFLALVGYLVYFNIALVEPLRANPNNTKKEEQKRQVTRGSIYSADGALLARTEVDALGNETRTYPYGNLFAHVVGYVASGKAGVEAMCNTELLTSHTALLDRISKEGIAEDTTGDSVTLTLDSALQRVASDALGTYRGAVVVMEPSTGRVLAMVSKPDFDPNLVGETWETLNGQEAGSPLLNRAMQGLYPPGSTFKILTTLAYIRQNATDAAYQDYTYNCEGVIRKEDVSIQCYNGEVHGMEDLRGSFQHSCNTSFANIGLGLDLGQFADLCDSFLFNQDLPTLMPYSSSRFSMGERASYGEVMATSIGQGNTLVTPFHMALVTCAVANNGVLMRPYFAERVENAQGTLVKETVPEEAKRLMSQEEAEVLSSYMQSVVEGGTAASLWNGAYTVAGKTGSAEYEEQIGGEVGAGQSTHSWFVGFSNVADPDIAVSVIAEGAGTGSSVAVPVAKAVFDAYYAARGIF